MRSGWWTKAVERKPDWRVSSGTVCVPIATWQMVAGSKQLGEVQKGCSSLGSAEFSDGLNVCIVLPDNGALWGDFPRQRQPPFVPSVARSVPFLPSFFFCIDTDSRAPGFTWLSSLATPVHVQPQERRRPCAASATMAVRGEAGGRVDAGVRLKRIFVSGSVRFFTVELNGQSQCGGLSLGSVSAKREDTADFNHFLYPPSRLTAVKVSSLVCHWKVSPAHPSITDFILGVSPLQMTNRNHETLL